MEWLKNLGKWFNHHIEIISQLITVVAISYVYGIIESKWIPTDAGNFAPIPICGGRWSYYHLFLVLLIAISSFSLALSHIQWLLAHRKKYILITCSALVPLGLLVEDIAWFITRWKPIARDEWTCIQPGWCFNIGFTYVPYWYIVVLIVTGGMLWIANILLDKGYKSYLEWKASK